MSIASRLKKRVMHVHTELMYAQQLPVLGGAVRLALWGVMGIDVPQRVKLGQGITLNHGAYGLVVYHGTEIRDRVSIFQGVTIGLKELGPDTDTVRIVIEEDAVLCAGAKILAGPEGLVVGRGTVVGANAVLLQSTGEHEIWAGVPARKVGTRQRRS